MKKQRLRKIRRICTAACFAVLFSSCAFIQRPVSESGFALYYLNEDLDQLETQGYIPSSSDTEALIEEVIAQQNRAPEGSRLASLLPAETVIRSYDLEGTTLTLDFSGSYYGMQTGREMLVRGGLVREFLQIVGVERLVFTVEEEPLTDSYGNEIGYMTNESFVENSAETINSYQSVTMTLYFTDSSGTQLLPESRKVYYISSEPLERAVVEEIIKGPRMTGRYSTYSTDSSVLSVISQGDVCYVNFGSSVRSSVLAVPEDIQIYSIVNSLADTCGVSEVQFSVDGDSSSVFRETMSLGETYVKNEELIGR